MVSSKKKVLSAFLSLAMIGSMVAAVPLTASAAETTTTATPGVTYEVQGQTYGWTQGWVSDGSLAGTVGQAKRLEAIKLKLTNAPAGASIIYEVQGQTYGWSQGSKADGDQAGTVGQAKRLEAIKITLKGMPGYEVDYKVQGQTYGWSQGWVKTTNGTAIADAALAGTVGQAKRLEAIEISIKKTDAEVAAEYNANAAVTAAETSKVQADVDAATAAVATVQDAAAKAAFTARIAAISVTYAVASVTAPNAVTVVVKFNKAVNQAQASNPANYTVGTSTVKSVSLSADAMTATLTLDATGTLLANGTTYPVTVKKAIAAVSGDTFSADYTYSLAFSDTTAPVLGAVSYPTNNSAKVSFSEPVKAPTSAVVLDSNNVDVTASIPVTLNAAAGTDETVDLTNATVGASYTVYLYGVQDMAGNPAGTTSFIVTKTNPDTTAPTVSSIKATSLKTFVVTYSEAVKYTTQTFTVDGSTATATSTTSSTDGTQLTVTLATALSAGNHYVAVTATQDLSGNTLSGTVTKYIDFEADTTAPAVKSISVNGNTLFVTFDDSNVQIQSIAPFSAAKYVADNVEYDSLAVALDSTKVSLYDPAGTLSSDTLAINLTGEAAGAYTATLAAGLVKDTAGNSSAAKSITFNYSPATTSTTKPTVSSVNVAGNTVTVTFSAQVTDASALNLGNYAIDGKNNVFTAAVFTSTAKTAVKLTLAAGTVNTTSSRLFTVKNVTDTSGNVMDNYSAYEPFVDNTAPVVVKAVLTNSTTITLTFNKKVKGTLTADQDFDVYIAGAKVAQTTGAAPDGSGTTITLTLASATTATSGITAVATSGQDIVDTTANANAFAGGTIAVSLLS